MIPIGAVSRQTGISAPTLRKWEERYGFPVPARTDSGQRTFSAHDLELLVEVSLRMAAGQRPSNAIRAVQVAMQDGVLPTTAHCYPADVSTALSLLHGSQLEALESLIERQLACASFVQFSADFALPLIVAIGKLWKQGDLAVYQEHLFTSIFEQVVQRGIQRMAEAPPGGLRVLLASPTGEMHTQALLLLGGLLREAGISSLHLNGALPAAEIAHAATAMASQVVALSASAAAPTRLLKLELQSLRSQLATDVRLWVGGAGAQRIQGPMQGIEVMHDLFDALQQLKTLNHFVVKTVGTRKGMKNVFTPPRAP